MENLEIPSGILALILVLFIFFSAFFSAAETALARIKGVLSNAKLAWMFENCFPNTLDTTVRYRKDDNGKDDTVVYTGDIHAMWLRDSGAQVWPYLQLANKDEHLRI